MNIISILRALFAPTVVEKEIVKEVVVEKEVLLPLLKEAFKWIGEREVAGPESNPRILELINRWTPAKNDGDVAWCSIWMNEICKAAGFEYTGELNAQSWLKLDSVQEPELGKTICVFWRESPDSWKGHVGIYIREDEQSIYVLGGNQDNSVRVSPYPKDRLKGYRTPKRK